MEALLLLFITMLLINIVALCANANFRMHKMDKEGFYDYEVQNIYQER